MATRFYFRLSEAAAVTPTVRGTWDDSSEGVNRRMHTVKENSAITIGQTIDMPSATPDWRDLDRIYVSDPMDSGVAFVMADTVKMQLMVREFAANDNVDSVHIGLFIISQDGATLRATLLPTDDYAGRTEFINNATCRNKTAADGDAVTENYTTVAGDRLQLEVGYRVSVSGGTTPQAAAKWGDNATDLPENQTQTTDGAGWFEISRNITFQANAVRVTGSETILTYSAPARVTASEIVFSYLIPGRVTASEVVFDYTPEALSPVRVVASESILDYIGTARVVASETVLAYNVPARVIASETVLDYVSFDITEYGSVFLYDESNWGGKEFYFEVFMRATAGTIQARLFDVTADAPVAGTELSTESTDFIRLRTSAIKVLLIDGHEYRAQFGKLGADAGEFLSARLIAFGGA